MKYKTFETERLFIRPTSENDAAFIFHLLNTPKWIKYIGDRNVRTVDKAKEYIKEKMIPQLERLGYANYTVIRKEDHQKIGTCGLYDREGFDGIDIGFAFLPDFEKRGYAFEASNRIKDAAFNEFGIGVISAFTTIENTSSQKLLEKLGLKLNGTTKLPNDDEELLLYKIEKQKYMKYKIVPNFFSVIVAIILGTALYKQFDFQSLKFEKPALAVIYIITFIVSIGFMMKKSKDK